MIPWLTQAEAKVSTATSRDRNEGWGMAVPAVVVVIPGNGAGVGGLVAWGRSPNVPRSGLEGGRQLDPGAQPTLPQHAGDVMFDSLGAEEQLRRDLPIRQTAGDAERYPGFL